MKEIGGYFELEHFNNNEYYNSLISLNTGRNALLYILKAKKIKKLYVPFFLCDVIKDILLRNNYDFEYYSVNQDFMPLFNKNIANNEFLYVVNYYGQISNKKVFDLKERFTNIILDNTHAFFQKPMPNIDTIYSCRKFFGVPDGAYLSTDTKLKDKFELDISSGRMTHLIGRHEKSATIYYDDFKRADESFKFEDIKYMSKITHNILGAIDYENVRKIRNVNYSYLCNKLSIYNILNLENLDGAFAYPFYIENGIEIRKVLAKNKIFIPTLWPNVIEEMHNYTIEYKYAANILPLPCDQRYTVNDMELIYKEIKNVQVKRT